MSNVLELLLESSNHISAEKLHQHAPLQAEFGIVTRCDSTLIVLERLVEMMLLKLRLGFSDVDEATLEQPKIEDVSLLLKDFVTQTPYQKLC